MAYKAQLWMEESREQILKGWGASQSFLGLPRLGAEEWRMGKARQRECVDHSPWYFFHREL